MKLKALLAAAAMLVAGVGANAATTFAGYASGASFTVPAVSFSVGAGDVGTFSGSVYSGPVTIGPLVFAGLSLTSASVGSLVDNDLSDGFSFTGLAAGVYTLSLSGSAGPTGGFYGGTYTLTTTPVPEVDVGALALAGLGVVGLLRRRRQA